MRLAIGCDHRGLELKKAIQVYLSQAGHEYQDFGCYSAESCDYPDVALPVARAVAGGHFPRGILVCATGIGMCMAANKVRGIRAALAHDLLTARRAREHNDANILCLGGKVVKPELAREMVQAFLTTPFQGGHHQLRLDKVKEMEGGLGSPLPGPGERSAC